MSARAFLSIKTQFENVGDALINRELVRILAARMPVTVDLSRCPPSFARTLGLDEIDNVAVAPGGFPGLLAGIVTALIRGERCYYFLLPGGLGGEKSKGQLLAAHAYARLLGLLKLLGVRIVHAGISYDHLGPNYRALIATRARHLFSHAVRDRISFEYLEGLGIRVDTVVPDLALNLFSNHREATGTERACIAFSFRADKYRDRRPEIEALVARVAAMHPRARLKFVSQVERDDALMRELCTQLAARADRDCVFVACSRDIETCQAAYRDCAEIYSNRLHALIIAMHSGCAPVPVIDWRHDVKIAGVFESIGMAKAIVELGGAPPEHPLPVDRLRLRAEADRIGAYFDALLEARPVPERSMG